MKAVINTSVLVALGKLGYLRLIGKLFDKLVIAECVFEEIRDSEVFVQFAFTSSRLMSCVVMKRKVHISVANYKRL